MPISVICPGCHTRFKVSEKFAGKTGACPKCKNPIQVPDATNEVVIHEPELEAGAKDARGRSVLKPIRRKDTKFNPLVMTGAVGLAVVAVGVAWAARSATAQTQIVLMAIGAVVVAVPLSWAGYFFLRDDELEGYRSTSLAIRTGVCALAYAGLWGVYALLYPRLFGEGPFEIWNALPLLPFLAVGTGVAYVCYDLDLGSGFFHYSFYVAVTILLRLIMGLPALGPPAKESPGVALVLGVVRAMVGC